MEREYTLRQKVNRGIGTGLLFVIGATGLGSCATIRDFAKDQVKPYIFYSKDGILNEKTGEREHSFPYYKTEPFETYATLGFHIVAAGTITYGAIKYNKSQQTTPVNDDPIIEDDPIVDDPVEDDPEDDSGSGGSGD